MAKLWREPKARRRSTRVWCGDGKETLDAVRGPYAALGRAGYRLHLDPDDPSAAGRWLDRDGNQAADSDIRGAIRQARNGAR